MQKTRHTTKPSLRAPASSNNKKIRAISQCSRAGLAFPTHSNSFPQKHPGMGFGQTVSTASLVKESTRAPRGPALRAAATLPNGCGALAAGSGSCGSAFQLLTASPSHLGASQESHLLLADLPLPKWIPISQLTPSY